MREESKWHIVGHHGSRRWVPALRRPLRLITPCAAAHTMRLTARERSGTGAQGRLGAPGGAWAGDARREPRRISNAPIRQDHRLRAIWLSLHS